MECSIFEAHKNSSVTETLHSPMGIEAYLSFFETNSSLCSVFLNKSSVANVRELKVLALTSTVK